MYSFCLITSGAIGNLGERGWNLIFNQNGKVTDFIELLFIPSFNFADVYITFGIIGLFYMELRKINIEIVHENENFVIVNKPAGVLTHPVQNSDENTIQDYLKENFRIDYEFEDDRQGIVHRLDRVQLDYLFVL